MNQMNIMQYVKRDNCLVALNDYKDSKPQLRVLFHYSCCYCTIHEGENSLGFFHVDHFKPYSLFNGYKKEYNNLYYACHKCNVHKSNHWISVEDGCIRDCDSCNNKVCEEKEISRFLDPCNDIPSEHLQFEEGSLAIVANNNSKIGDFTINMLRLNRSQLTRLRQARRNLFMWLETEKEKLDSCLNRLNNANEQKIKFETLLERYPHDEKIAPFTKVVNLLFDQKIKIYQQQLLEIEFEIKRVADVVYEKAAPFEW